jgi:hypothetical protein
MNDHVTAVAYVSNGESNSKVFNKMDVKWNSKRWRALVHIDHTRNVILISKHYPFYSEGIERELVQLLEETFQREYKVLLATDSPYKEDQVVASNFFANGKNRSNFNDFNRSNQDKKKVLISRANSDFQKIIIGRAAPCLICGENYITNASSFCCDNCNSYEECERCGYHGEFGEALGRNRSGEIYCESCLDEERPNEN